MGGGSTTGASRSPNRRSYGEGFFRTWQVLRYVRPIFRPATDFGGRLAGLSPYGEFSHWVGGASSVMLMEPVVPSRSQHPRDLRELARLFASARFALGDATPSLAKLVAFVLPGGSDSLRADAVDSLSAAHEVVDVEDDAQRRRLIEQVRELGESTRLA